MSALTYIVTFPFSRVCDHCRWDAGPNSLIERKFAVNCRNEVSGGRHTQLCSVGQEKTGYLLRPVIPRWFSLVWAWSAWTFHVSGLLLVSHLLTPGASASSQSRMGEVWPLWYQEKHTSFHQDLWICRMGQDCRGPSRAKIWTHSGILTIRNWERLSLLQVGTQS